MSNILITVDDQKLVCTGKPVIASQGVKEDYVVFTFSSEWNGFGKTAYFFKEKDKETVYVSVVDINGKALVPWEATDEDGAIYIGVYGVAGDVVYTSDMLRYEIKAGLYTAGQQSEELTPGVYQQILSLLGNMQQYITDEIDGVKAELAMEGATRSSADDALSGRITANGARIDNIISSFNTNTEEEVLFEGSAKFYGTSYTLTDDVSNYDYLDIYLKSDSTGRRDIRTVPVNEGVIYVLDVVNIGDYVNPSSSHPFIQVTELSLTISGQTMTIENHTWFSNYLDGSQANVSGRISSSSSSDIISAAAYISKVIGRQSVENVEISDIRTGYDGTTYQSAGDAVRGQVSDLHDDLDNKITVSGTSLIIMI